MRWSWSTAPILHWQVRMVKRGLLAPRWQRVVCLLESLYGYTKIRYALLGFRVNQTRYISPLCQTPQEQLFRGLQGIGKYGSILRMDQISLALARYQHFSLSSKKTACIGGTTARLTLTKLSMLGAHRKKVSSMWAGDFCHFSINMGCGLLPENSQF